MIILGIETSCDETGAAVIEAELGDTTVKLLSNTVASSLALHAKTGGIIPEVAAREQIKYIIPVIEKALRESLPSTDYRLQEKNAVDRRLWTVDNIDAIAVTTGPGLIGSLLVGVETAKTLAYVWNKPIVPVNHLIGHIYANFVGGNSNFEFRISNLKNIFPAIVLVVSGGHTDLLLIPSHGDFKWFGGTRDDAAGEAFDKIGRLLGLPYPAGPVIAKLAEKGNPKAINFPRPMLDSNDFDFSFSGLKTAVLRETTSKYSSSERSESRSKSSSRQARTINLSKEEIADMSASVQQAIVDVLVAKTIKAARVHKVKSILISGGVAANDLLRSKLEVSSQKVGVNFFAPAKKLCADNAAMIASAAFFNYRPALWKSITANPSLHF